MKKLGTKNVVDIYKMVRVSSSSPRWSIESKLTALVFIFICFVSKQKLK